MDEEKNVQFAEKELGLDENREVALDLVDSVESSEEYAKERAAVSSAYEIKSRLINECFQDELGFGRYQWGVFMLTGLGWMADNIWFQAVAIILPQVQVELPVSHVEYATLSLYAGLIVGASTWGILADVVGRRLSFNITLFIAGVFGIAAGGAGTFTQLGALIACIGFGVGGNLPVDGAIFLEVIPKSYQWLLTLLSIWWALGQLFASLIAWPLINNFSCASDADSCLKADNMGWRYTVYICGGITFLMFVARFFLFNLQESPKFLVAKGRDEEAIKVLEYIAARNGRTITLTLEKLEAAGGVSDQPRDLSSLQLARHSFSSLSLGHIKPLFATRTLALNTSLTIALWGLIGLASPLFNGFITLYLKARTSGSDSINETYRNYSIISVLGIPGSIIACIVVDRTRRSQSGFVLGGRKFSMAVFTALTGVFLFLFTTATNQAGVLGYNCASTLTTNAMFGVLYAYTPEVFPAPHRGTGDGLASSTNRILGILAPVIKIATTRGATTAANTNVPVFVSASLFLGASILMLLLPIETAGKAAL
ncbi:MFS general substrate transporter [Peniophora sp. CONT]|nr:MFS general substrate transporter [Peniophora sp. CONT]